ncbi:MAG TPA: diaminopimelate epimerase [Candidatus Nanoarchaeia archaeon]|nr:diaminopimelate epimerase [Candidatus Nanoarchaeia archaeon]
MNFWKMHGLGNDFIVIDNRIESISEKEAPAIAKKLCDRRFGVGADGILLVSNSNTSDIGMRTFNADGSEPEMCGNGTRCFAKYCYENGIVKKEAFAIETKAGPKPVWLTVKNNEVDVVKVDMGTPNWNRESLPMIGQGPCINEPLQVDEDETYNVTCLSVGNPHCVIFVENVDETPVEYVGPLIENHKAFPKRTNVEFVQVLSKYELKIRVWERGCGETFACGTGTCASVAAANKLAKVKDKVTVHLLGGDLQVDVAKTLLMTGPASKVFEGKLF